MMMKVFERLFQSHYVDSFFEMLVTDDYDKNRSPTLDSYKKLRYTLCKGEDGIQMTVESDRNEIRVKRG